MFNEYQFFNVSKKQFSLCSNDEHGKTD